MSCIYRPKANQAEQVAAIATRMKREVYGVSISRHHELAAHRPPGALSADAPLRLTRSRLEECPLFYLLVSRRSPHWI